LAGKNNSSDHSAWSGKPTLPNNWWTEEQNTAHKSVTCWDHVRASAYMPIPGLDAGGITPEVKPKTEIQLFLTWFFFLFCFVFFLLFSLLLWRFFVFIFVSIYFLYYQLHLHYLLIPNLTPFMLPSSPVLQSIAPLPNYSFCPFSSTLSSCLYLPLPAPPTCHQTIPPSSIFTTWWPTYCTNFTQPQPFLFHFFYAQPTLLDTGAKNMCGRKDSPFSNGAGKN
jgi:hypothetical protein